MRTIKFRGQNIKGEWHYGLLSYNKDITSDYEWFISNKAGKPFAFGAIEKSIGQFTGLHDKNGKELYEGDIISDMEDEPMVLPVIFDNEYSQFAVDVSYHKDGSSVEDIPTCYENGFEIVGNVFENPDLVKL